MKEYSQKLLDKALDAIEAAQALADIGKFDIAAGRAYYAMFYVAEALLNEKDLRFNKHSAVHASFGEHFARTKEMDVKFHRWLLDAFDKRLVGDYGVDTDLERDAVVYMINQAHEFLVAAREYLQKQESSK
jgi:uncharacterized protein (UPF0332 family)